MITGDFNYPNIDLESWSTPDGDIQSNLYLEVLENEFNMYHLLLEYVTVRDAPYLT